MNEELSVNLGQRGKGSPQTVDIEVYEDGFEHSGGNRDRRTSHL